METTITGENTGGITGTGGKNTAQASASTLYFAVLVPHRDCLPAVEAYRRALFAAGAAGAFAFPAAAPLALLKRPLSAAEFKAAAAELGTMLGGGKITLSGAVECSGWDRGGSSGGGAFTEAIRFFGLALELPRPAFSAEAVSRFWERPVLAPALLAAGDTPPRMPLTALPAVAFRAAALANCAVQPEPEAYSLRWETGPLYWLPRRKESRRG